MSQLQKYLKALTVGGKLTEDDVKEITGLASASFDEKLSNEMKPLQEKIRNYEEGDALSKIGKLSPKDLKILKLVTKQENGETLEQAYRRSMKEYEISAEGESLPPGATKKVENKTAEESENSSNKPGKKEEEAEPKIFF